MSDHLHSREYLDSNDVVEVESDTQCNVMLMTDTDYSNFKSRRDFQYIGGFFKSFPARLVPNHSGNWNIVLSLPPGHRATIRHSIDILRG